MGFDPTALMRRRNPFTVPAYTGGGEAIPLPAKEMPALFLLKCFVEKE